MNVHQRLQALALTFPTLHQTPDEIWGGPHWDPIAFAQYWAKGSGGELDAALFVLSVWNATTDWSEWITRNGKGRFDVHTALSNWDSEHRAAFVAWVKDPWWC